MHGYPDPGSSALRRAIRNAAGALALVVAPLAVLGLWAQLVLLDASEFAGLADSTMQEHEVQVALSDAIYLRLTEASPLLETPEVDTAVREAVRWILSQEEFRHVLRVAVEALHRDISEGEETLQLQVVEEVTDMLRHELGEPLADFVPEPREVAPVTLAGTGEYRALRTAVRTADVTSVLVLAGAAATAAALLLFARRRAHAAVYVGLAGALGAAGIIVTLFVLPSLGMAGVNGEPEGSIYTVFAGSIAGTALLAAVVCGAVGLLGAVAALVAGRSRAPDFDWR